MFPPNGQNAPGAQVTGDENDAFEQFVMEGIRKVVAEGQKSDTQPPLQPQVVPPAAATGITFANQEQLQAFIQQYNAQTQQQVASPPQQTNQVTGKELPDYTVDQFVEQVTKDPRRAILDAIKGAGIDLEDLAKNSTQMRSQFEDQQKVLAAEQFKANFPDFPANPQAGNIVEAVRTQYSLPFDLKGLTAAYSIANQAGYMNQFRQQQGQQLQPGQYQPPPNLNTQYQGGYPQPQQSYAPPRVPRAGYEPPEDFARMAEDMSTDQLEKYFERFNNR